MGGFRETRGTHNKDQNKDLSQCRVEGEFFGGSQEESSLDLPLFTLPCQRYHQHTYTHHPVDVFGSVYVHQHLSLVTFMVFSEKDIFTGEHKNTTQSLLLPYESNTHSCTGYASWYPELRAEYCKNRKLLMPIFNFVISHFQPKKSASPNPSSGAEYMRCTGGISCIGNNSDCHVTLTGGKGRAASEPREDRYAFCTLPVSCPIGSCLSGWLLIQVRGNYYRTVSCTSRNQNHRRSGEE